MTQLLPMMGSYQHRIAFCDTSEIDSIAQRAIPHNDVFRSATFSSDPLRTYRYSLERRWGPGDSTVAFVCLNPSTADEYQDDPTVRRCIGFARSWGFDGLVILNLFALRSTDPKMLYSTTDPVGPDNDAALFDWTHRAGITVAAWGNHGAYRHRGRTVSRLLVSPRMFGLTLSQEPRHPLYLPSTATLFSLPDNYREPLP